MFHIFTAYALCNSNLFTALCKRINTPLFTTNIKAEVHLREIVQFRRHFRKKKRFTNFYKICLTDFDKFKIFVCNDSSNEMRTISFIWNDYSAFTSLVNFD